MKTTIFFISLLLCNATSVFSQGGKQPAAKAAPLAARAAKPAPAAVKAESSANLEIEKFKAEQDKQKAEQDKLQKAQELVQEWFRRWNALDGTEESANRFVALYQPDASHQVGPGENQIGPAFYEGRDLIRKMAEQSAERYTRLAYYVKARTVNEKTAELLFASANPWGGISVTAEFGASYDLRSDGKRYMAPGAAIFEIQNEKISRVRLYHSEGETAQVTGPFNAGCGN